MYGVLVVTRNILESERVQQFAIVPIDGGVKYFNRFTDGKQGRANAWQIADEGDLISDVYLVGNPVAVPITAGDLNDYTQSGIPSVLLQKLVNAFSRQSNDLITDDAQQTTLVLNEIAHKSPEELKQYFSDNRGRKPKSESVEAPRVEAQVSEELVSVGSPHLFVPPIEKYAHHVERKFAGDVTEFQIAEFAIANRMNILASGDAGTGKTEFAYWFAAKTGRNIAVVQSTGSTDISSMAGAYYPHPSNGKLVWDDGWLTSVVRNGGVVLIDEVSMLPRNIAAFLHPLLDDRRSLILDSKFGEKVVPAHPDLLIIAGMNPNYRGTHLLNEAFKDRFDIKLTYGYDKAIEAKIVKSDSLRDLANRMRAQSGLDVQYSSSQVAFETPITPRLLKAFEKIAVALGFDFARDVFVNNFSDEEQSAVRTLLEGLEFNIRQDLGL